MKKYYSSKVIFTFIFALISTTGFAQNVQLLAEDFEATNSFTYFTLNTAGPGGGSGVNRWIINDSYSGTLPYPNTPPQDSVNNNGQIGNAPYGHYMHIYDSGFGLSQGDTNACYDPSQQSDIFTEVTGNMCTLGMIDVTVAFFYSCVGSSTAYGELYYSANGGPWTQVGPQYNQTNIWQYETVTDPAFSNIANLKFGFRWQNTATGDPVTRSFAVDDINIVATFNAAGVTLAIDSVWPNPICPNRYLFVQWSLSQPLCNGTYMYEMSDFTGNFANPVMLGVININNGQLNGINAVFIPSATFPGNCYKIRLRRMYPAPIFVGTASACFTIQFCLNTITTLGTPVIAMDSNAVCAGSVIDVNFFSTGTYILNTYQLQLSDKNGNFVPPDSIGANIIGSLPSNITYDPANPTPGYPPPGSVSGLIPDTVSASCFYKIRIVGTGPATGPAPVIGTEWGPFCIQHCDIITNNEQDIGFCLYPQDSICVPLRINVNFYDSNAVYLPGNQFMVQVISRGPIPPPFTLVGTTGALGTFTAINDTTVSWCISYALLAQAGIPPGSYYMRIVATNSSIGADSAFGSMIRLTIGAPSTIPYTIHAVDWVTFQPVDTICSGDLVYFYLTPNPDPNAKYHWYSAQLQGSPVVQNALLVNFAGFSGNFTVYVRENSYGCLGPASDPVTIYVKPFPNVSVSQPGIVCVGDTVTYSVPFVNNTYWSWSLSTGIGTIIDTVNNTVTVVFSSVGVDTVFCQGLNSCGSKTGFRKVTVRDYPVLLPNNDTTVCRGSPLMFIAPHVTTVPAYQYQWRLGSTIISANDTLSVSPIVSSAYLLSVSNGGYCYQYDTINVTVEQPPVTNFSDSLCIGDTLTLDATTAAAISYLWNDSSGSTTPQINISSSGIYTAHVVVPGEICYRQYDYNISFSYPDTTAATSSVCVAGTTTLTAQFNGSGYLWNTGDTTNQITVADSGQYFVTIEDPSRLCPHIEKFNVALEIPDTAKAPEYLCAGETISLQAQDTSSGNTYSWNTGETTATISVNTPGIYSVVINNPSWVCPKIETFDVTPDQVSPCSEYNLPNVFSPDGSGLNNIFYACSHENTDPQFHAKCPPLRNITNVDMKIFNRWGELVYETTDKDIKWNGKINNTGNDCPDGVYYYTCIANFTYPVQGKPSKALHGFITIVRKK